ncbi:phage tail assembly chaperone [Pseudomonas aeruginosa]|uniref:phage tail assembly chaperone n=1 Tax=Pseudomonas aeruginosa TaxID=287 RepID=UPI00093B144F|nr:phage tail assembly chaperone [Pseudomonas aeruginosa]
MKRLYSPSTGCTYIEGVHNEIPGDAMPITEQRFLEVIANPEPGKVRDHDAAGLPILVDPTPESGEVTERRWRDAEIVRVSWLRDRHRDEAELGIATTLEAAQFHSLLAYIQQLRDWPQATPFPNAEERPQAPAWVASQEPANA